MGNWPGEPFTESECLTKKNVGLYAGRVSEFIFSRIVREGGEGGVEALEIQPRHEIRAKFREFKKWYQEKKKHVAGCPVCQQRLSEFAPIHSFSPEQFLDIRKFETWRWLFKNAPLA